MYNTQSLTTLIGRKAEIRALVDLLTRPEVRLVTLTGVGGVGKTRLAQQTAQVMDFADGVYFVSLADVQHPDQVGDAIAHGLGLRTKNPTAIAAFFAQKEALLVV